MEINEVKLDLTEDLDARKEIMKNERNIEILESVKEIFTLGNTEFVTAQMVADYFEVGLEAIKSLIKDNKEELEQNGLKTYSKKDFLKVLKEPLRNNEQLNGKSILTFADGYELIYPNRGLMMISKRVLLNIGMLLRDSEVAKELRRRILDIVHDAEESKGSIETIVEEINKEQQLTKDVNELIELIEKSENTLEKNMFTSILAFKQQELAKLQNERIKKLEEEINGLETIIDRMFNKDSLYSIRDIGKSLKDLSFSIKDGSATFGANNIFEYLRDRGILYRKGRQNRPYAQYEGKYIQMKLSERTDFFDNPIYVCYFTVEGVKWFFKRIVKENIIDEKVAKEMVKRMATESAVDTEKEEKILPF